MELMTEEEEIVGIYNHIRMNSYDYFCVYDLQKQARLVGTKRKERVMCVKGNYVWKQLRFIVHDICCM